MSAPFSPDSPGFRALFPYESHFFSIGGNRIHYIDEGSGPLLLILHACPLWSFSYRNIIRDFSKDHRVIAIDQMGFGLSDKPLVYDYRMETHIEALETFIGHMDLHNITFISHGRGSTIAMAYAVRNPDNVRAFVTMNAMAFSDFPLPLRLQICRIRWFGVKIVMHLNLFFWELAFLSRQIRKCYLMQFSGNDDKIAMMRFIEDIPCDPEDDSAQSMYEIEAGLWMLRDKPAAILWAKHDWLYTKYSLRKWIKYFPEAEVHHLKHSGRYLPENEPDKLNELIRDFLERSRC